MTRSRSSCDEPQPSSSHLPRSISPLHFHTTNSKHTRAQDISRLLDPSYSAQPATNPTAVYVDHHGDAHDPDYRHFPVAQPKRGSRGAYAHSSRPRWELYDEDALDLDDEDMLDEDADDSASFFSANRYLSPTRNNYSSSSRRSSSVSQRRSKAQSNSFGTYSRAGYSSSGYYSSPPYSAPYDTPPTSYETEESVLEHTMSPFGDEHSTKEKERRTLKALKRKRCSPTTSSSSPAAVSSFLPGSPTSTHSAPAPRPSSFVFSPSYTPSHPSHLHDTNGDAEDEQEPESLSSEVSPPAAEWTPTCTQSLRRQWQAISLRFRFGVFRAQKRVQRRVHSLL